MKKILMTLILGLVFTAACAQMDIPLKQGMPNTVTLSNGEVIYDLSGEWDAFYENYGSWSHIGSYPDVLKIAQKGAIFVGIKQIGSPYVGKGAESIRGELDKSGFKKVQVLTSFGYFDCKGQISEDGNKIIIDEGITIRVTLTRK